ncbi:extracellular solute-binding protein [Paenibacillus agricola]|uniref:Extracellular solute-binding protein n=1 Tax=Paenibacillus agricola TaxID=2716264 RepID=A0ABX0J9I8_9BACL|nr:extracellular solute-binding protein [Paenibacillus agricola]NHN33112.1 extracellular solute-binding protein [Paenibacillus agricola]
MTIKRIQTNKKVITATTGVVLLSTLLTACSGGTPAATNGTTPGATAPVDNKPVEISIFTRQQGAQAVEPTNPVLLEIEKLTNTKLNITWVPFNSYTEKTKVALASGDIAEMMVVDNIYDPQVVQMANSGAFWDVTPFIKDYKILNSWPKEIWDNAKIKGKNYGIVRPRPLEGGWGVQLRKDWLDKLGMQVPETMDQMYEVVKAFTEKDPDGNGKADTVGLTANVDVDGMGALGWIENVFIGAVGKWKLTNGQLTPTFDDPGQKKALEWIKKAYDEKLLTPDFAVLKSTQAREQYMGHKAGILGSAVNPQWLFTDAMRKTVPTADSFPLTYLMGPDGKFAGKDTGTFGMFVIPKTVPEAKVKQILAFMDKGSDEAVTNFSMYGLPDKHYTIKDGIPVFTEQAKTDNVADISNNLAQIFTRYDKYLRAYYNGIPKEYHERNKKLIDDREAFSKPDAGFGLISQTALTVGPDLYKKLQDMKIKVILGKEPMSAWDDYVAKLKADPQFQKIIQETNDAYKSK